MKRKKISQRKSKRDFTRKASKINGMNLSTVMSFGGTRL